MKTLIVTCVLLLFTSPSYTSRIDLQWNKEDGLVISMQGKENLAEVSIYLGRELLVSFIPTTDTIKIKRECPLPNKIRYVVTLKKGLVVDDRGRMKTNLLCSTSFFEIYEPKD